MIPCYICNAPIGSGWLCGPPPAAAGHKLGLCPEHDTPANRELVLTAWEAAIQRALGHPASTGAAGAASRTGPALPALHGQQTSGHDLTVQFLDGGSLSIACDSYEIDQDRASLICRSGDNLEFFPLQHIRRIRALPRPLAPTLN
ncbi:hypothetical protein [Megalodesulfovibrio paquesii]